MRFALYGLLTLAALVVQIAWLGHVSVGGAVVDPLLVMIMVVGLLHGPEEGALVGAGAGLLQDVMTGVPLGLGMLGGVAVGFAAGLGQRGIYVENLWLPALAAAVLTALRNAVWIGAALLAGLLNPALPELVRVTLAAACYNGAVAIPLFHGLRRLDSALVRLYERPR